MTSSLSIEGYYREADAWDADRVAQYRRTARQAWWIAAAACTCATAAVAALTMLVPLKRVEPFVVRVDNSTGVVDLVPTYTGSVTQEEAVTRYFLSHYVSVCERFYPATAESDYEECGAFHTPQRNQIWYARWVKTNPESPLNLHKDGSTIRIQVTAVSFLGSAGEASDIAQVRYLKTDRQGYDGAESTSHWIGTLRFAYGAPPGDPKVRRWNPLGFKVVDFRSEPEVLGESPPAKGVAQ
ncbi:MAG TPA: type IV secretion system protein [Steroidobacteraceae bacterium]|nr:type IV secretion system protein [Steroidobacteraceae bacterium]